MTQKFRVYCHENNSMILAEDYEDISNLFMCLNSDDSFFSDIMQSTGLFDSSEQPKEIFEGDIIRFEVPNQSMCSIYEVRRSNSGEWRIDNRIQGRSLYDSLNNIIIIGNIYEHPYLLEQE